MSHRACASVITRRTLVKMRDELNTSLLGMRDRWSHDITLPVNKVRNMVHSLNAAILRETPKGPKLPDAPFD